MGAWQERGGVESKGETHPDAPASAPCRCKSRRIQYGVCGACRHRTSWWTWHSSCWGREEGDTGARAGVSKNVAHENRNSNGRVTRRWHRRHWAAPRGDHYSREIAGTQVRGAGGRAAEGNTHGHTAKQDLQPHSIRGAGRARSPAPRAPVTRIIAPQMPAHSPHKPVGRGAARPRGSCEQDPGATTLASSRATHARRPHSAPSSPGGGLGHGTGWGGTRGGGGRGARGAEAKTPRTAI